MTVVMTVFGPRILSDLIAQEGSRRRIITAPAIVAAKDWQGLWIEFSTGCTVTIPSDLPDDFSCGWSQEGSSPVIFAAGAGATIQSLGGALSSGGQYAMGAIAGRGAGVFRLYGSLTS